MGGPNGPEAYIQNETLASDNHNKINCIDDHIKQEQESYLAVHPDLDPTCKIVKMHQELWKYQSKMNDMTKEVQAFKLKMTAELELTIKKMNAIQETGFEYFALELFQELLSLMSKVQSASTPIFQKYKATTLPFSKMIDRIDKEISKLALENTVSGQVTHLHPELTMDAVLRFLLSCLNCLNSRFSINEELLPLQRRVMDELSRLIEMRKMRFLSHNKKLVRKCRCTVI